MTSHQKSRDELTRRIEAVEIYIDECSEPGPRRSSAIVTAQRLREERDAMDRDQSDLIAAVLDFARKLRTDVPERLQYRAVEPSWDAAIRASARLERDTVGFQLLRLLEDSGIDIHEGEER